jgi:hypothetical protein
MSKAGSAGRGVRRRTPGTSLAQMCPGMDFFSVADDSVPVRADFVPCSRSSVTLPQFQPWEVALKSKRFNHREMFFTEY